MRQNPENKNDRFSKTLESSTKKYQNFFDELTTFCQREGVVNAEGLTPLPLFKKNAYIFSSLMYLRNTTNTTQAMPVSFRQTRASVDGIKSMIARDTFSTPPDLSKLYKRLRDEKGLLFGDVIEHLVQGIYAVQDPRKYSLMSELIYLQAITDELFPEIPEPKDEREAVLARGRGLMGHDKGIRPREPREKRLLRMLKGDIELLSMLHIITDRYNIGKEEASERAEAATGTKLMRVIQDFFTRRPFKEPSAFVDLPALTHYREYTQELEDASKGGELRQKYLAQWMFTQYAQLWSSVQSFHDVASRYFFSDENQEQIAALPAVSWEDVRLSREVPSAMKTFFPEGELPLLVCIDPAPGKAYLATVGIVGQRVFEEFEEKAESADMARRMVNPLARPFSDSSYMRDTAEAGSLAFYVRRDGELVSYGDSTVIPKAILGPNYEVCRTFVQHALYNLTHADYVPGSSHEQKRRDPITRPELEERSNGIPSHPTLRPVPPEKSAEATEERNFLGRVAHSRLLPSGWLPSFSAWERVRAASETIELYAEVFDESGTSSTESIKLNLHKDFKLFRKELGDLREKYGTRIRFQTYVKETPVNGEAVD